MFVCVHTLYEVIHEISKPISESESDILCTAHPQAWNSRKRYPHAEIVREMHDELGPEAIDYLRCVVSKMEYARRETVNRKVRVRG